MVSDPSRPEDTSAGSATALELTHIDKRFGSVHANRSVSLRVAKGSIHGLIGENGAGKSTLMNIIYGFHQADSGTIEVKGRRVQISRPMDAIAAGIGMVHQHFMLVENHTVLENVILGAEGGRLLAGGLSRARVELERLAADYSLEVPLDARIEDLTVGFQQRVEILKALYHKADILILDEPTAVLTPQEADQLFRMLQQLKSQGRTVLLVTHKLREIMAITDRVTVMRQGAVVHETPTSQTSPQKLAEQMVGRAVLLRVDKKPGSPGKALLEVKDLEYRDSAGVPRLKGVSLAVRAGEIVGIAGVAGNGQSELLDCLSGIKSPSRGSVVLNGRAVSDEKVGPRELRSLGLAHVPEDRLRVGVVAGFPAESNAILGYHDSPAYVRRGLLDRGAVRQACSEKMAQFDVRPPLPALRFSAFSGGNQQKLVIARELGADPRVLLVGQPTRGVDIGAIEFIHRRLVEMRDAGKAVLVVSVELDEILGLADRILVMAGGEIVGELSQAEASEEKIGLLMAGVRAGAPS